MMLYLQVYSASFNSLEKAKQHPIIYDKPAVNFFEGAVLGNGGLGVIVRTRPDAVVLHFSHNDVWDIRIAEENKEKYKTFRQILPAMVPEKYNLSQGHPKDRAIRLTARVNQSIGQSYHIKVETGEKTYDYGALNRANSLLILAQLEEGLASQLPEHMPDMSVPDEEKLKQALKASNSIWENYWNCSGIQLDDTFLEKIWYHNSYFFNCSVKEGTTCPGLFANWSYKSIGTAWHGDYHLDYNWQQPFWLII